MGVQDTSWKGLKAFLAQSGIIRQIATLDVTTVSDKVLATVRKHVSDNPAAFDQPQIARVSRAAAPLAKWIVANLQFTEIYTNIEPLIKTCEEANQRLNDLRQQLKETKESIGQLEAEATELKKNFDKKTSDLIKYQDELKIIESKKAKGDKMLSGLVKERQRWAANEQQLDV